MSQHSTSYKGVTSSARISNVREKFEIGRSKNVQFSTRNASVTPAAVKKKCSSATPKNVDVKLMSEKLKAIKEEDSVTSKLEKFDSLARKKTTTTALLTAKPV